MCQPQKVVLVATAVIARFKYRIVRQIFQVMTHFPFQQPNKRIHPTDDTNQFANNHVDRMPLVDMRTLVCQNLIDLFLGMLSGCRNTSRKKEKGPAGLLNRCTRTLRIKATSDRRASNKMLLNCTKKRSNKAITPPQ